MERGWSHGGSQTRGAASRPAGDGVMKQTGTFGFVRVARYTEAVEYQKRAESRALRLEQKFETSGKQPRGWKAKADQANEALKQVQKPRPRRGKNSSAPKRAPQICRCSSSGWLNQSAR